MIHFAYALLLSAVVHALALGVVWIDQPAAGLGPAHAAATPIYRSVAPRPDAMGASNGIGQAANSAEGIRPAQSHLAQQRQAALGREPTGVRATAAPRPIPPVAAPAQSTPAASIFPHDSDAAAMNWKQPRFLNKSRVPDLPARPRKGSTPARGASAPSSAVQPPTPPGDPYPQSDSESDPFSKVEHVKMRNGRVDAKFGRKVKTVRPRFGPAAEADVADHVQLSVVLKVNTDLSGRVFSVDILQSCGSIPVDLAVRLAMYNWWIEPPRDNQGRPKADVMVWRISFQ
jgi:outer membrane biosynthesis protein TonB